MFENLLLPIAILFPILGAFASYLVGRRDKLQRDVLVMVLTVIEFALCVVLCVLARNGTSLTFQLTYLPNMNLTFKLDGFRLIYVLIISFMWMMTALFSKQYFAHYHNRNRYYFFTLLTLGATMGVFLSNDLLTTFVFFEIMSFTSYAWVAHEETPVAVRAANTYLAIAIIGGLVTLMGLFVFYYRFQTLSFEGLRLASQTADKASLYLPGILVFVGFSAKAGMFPLHVWLPKAHPVAPAPASALLSGVLTKAGVFGVLVISCNLFLHDAKWGQFILFLGAVTMCLGAVLALFSVNIKRILACSSMSQIGFITVGIGMMGLLGEHNALAAQGTLLHMVNHSLLKLVLFMVAGVVAINTHALNLDDIRGFARNKPALHCAYLLGMLGITGVPLFNGYISKTLLHESLLEYMHLTSNRFVTCVEALFVLCGGLTIAYMLKIYVCLFWERHETNQPQFDSMKKTYLSKLSLFALMSSAIVIPVMGCFANLVMTPLAAMGQPFLHAGASEHAVHYFASENLLGAGKSIVIGIIVYFFVVRLLLMRQKQYINRWPKKLDLENRLYRPVLMEFLPAVIGFFSRIADTLVDGIATILRMTLLKKKKTPQMVPVGTWTSYYLGRLLNTIAIVLNRTLLRRHPIKTDFVYALDVSRKEVINGTKRVTSSVSFGLLLVCIGIFITCWYLLA